MKFGHGEARRVRVLQDVCAVAVIVAVRDDAAHLMEARCPLQLACGAFAAAWRGLQVQRCSNAGYPFGLGCVD